MTTGPLSIQGPRRVRDLSEILAMVPGSFALARLAGLLRNLRIGRKLTIGFGLLVALILVVAGLSFPLRRVDLVQS